MPDKPELSPDTDRPERTGHEIGTNFTINQAFIDEVGEAKAARFRELLVDLSAEHRKSDIDVRTELERRVDAIGVRVSKPELDMFADEIVRSAGPVEELRGHFAGPARQDPDLS